MPFQPFTPDDLPTMANFNAKLQSIHDDAIEAASGIEDSSVTTSKLSDGAVTWPKLAVDARPIRRNLLDNACWAVLAAIINQRNVSGTITTPGYFIDRWKLVSGSVTLASNGLILNGTIAQIVDEPIISEVTASVLTETGIVPGEWGATTKTFSITATGVRLIAAKLEFGPNQTLAHQDADGNWVLNEFPDYGLELQKCQRYQVPLRTYDILRVRATTVSPNYIQFLVPIPSTLRAVPTIVNPQDLLVATVKNSPVYNFTFAVSGYGPGWVLITATKTNHGMDDAVLLAFVDNDNIALFDSNL